MRIAALAVLPLALLGLFSLTACTESDPAEPLLGASDSVSMELRGNFGEFYIGDSMRYMGDGSATRWATTNNPIAYPAPERELGRLRHEARVVLEELFRQEGTLPEFIAAPLGSEFPRSDLAVSWRRDGHQTTLLIEDFFAQPELPAAVRDAVELFATLPGD